MDEIKMPAFEAEAAICSNCGSGGPNLEGKVKIASKKYILMTYSQSGCWACHQPTHNRTWLEIFFGLQSGLGENCSIDPE